MGISPDYWSGYGRKIGATVWIDKKLQQMTLKLVSMVGLTTYNKYALSFTSNLGVVMQFYLKINMETFRWISGMIV